MWGSGFMYIANSRDPEATRGWERTGSTNYIIPQGGTEVLLIMVTLMSLGSGVEFH